ncbi:MAG: class I SAM-dependent methyltransferase [Planctomyces sp.]|nr:class I SAM-dependent methyltransferase [Planctomyces sp.]
MDIRESYDSAAAAYAEHLFGELENKPLDRHLLNRFAEDTCGRGLVADLGCGPGHVAGYLHQKGVSVVGIDCSAKMVAVARNLNPEIDFRIEDMRNLNASDADFTGIILFYSIVHFDSLELLTVFREVRRVLAEGGLALVSFHAGDYIVHRDDLFGSPVSLDFHAHLPERVIEALQTVGFKVIEEIRREPYEGAEYPSRRCYLVARAVKILAD